jgi:Lrp/AsnC family transcriptional regulator for asnA, asnC and gidA
MDDIDLQILERLRVNGRSRYTAIAEELGVVEGTVRNRVTKLMDDGVLQVIGMVDPHQMGYNAPAMIGVSIRPPHLEAASSAIAALPQVSYLILVSGGFDLIVEVMCEDRESLAVFLRDKLHNIPGVHHTETFAILHTYKMAHGAQTRGRGA